MRENRPSGLMRGGKQTVIGLVPLNPSLPAYSTMWAGALRFRSRQPSPTAPPEPPRKTFPKLSHAPHPAADPAA